jgi:hypothetical protein
MNPEVGTLRYLIFIISLGLISKVKNLLKYNSRNSSVGTATNYGLDDRMNGVRIPAGAGDFSLRHRVQTGSGAHQVSYPVGTGGSFPGGKAAGAWSWPLTSI